MTKEQSMKHSEMQAIWWTHYASSGACTKRELYHGVGMVKFTDEESIAEAFEIAQSHIKSYRDACES